MDVRDKLLDLCVVVLTVALQTIIDTLTEFIHRNPAPSQFCRTEMFQQKLLSQLLKMKFDITKDNFQQALGSVFAMIFCDVVSAETSIRLPPKFREAVQ